MKKIITVLFLTFSCLQSHSQTKNSFSAVSKIDNPVMNVQYYCPPPWVGYIGIDINIPPLWCGMPLDTIGVYLPPWCGCDGEEFITTFISPQTTTYFLYQTWDIGPNGIKIAIRPTDSTCSFNNFQLLYPDSCGSNFCIYKLNLDSGASYDILVDNCCDCSCYSDICYSIVIPPIQHINIGNVKPDSLTLLWDSIQGDVVVEYGPKNFSFGYGTKVLNPPNPFIIGGLTPHTIYDFYVYQEVDSIKSYSIVRNRITTAYRCDSTPYVYCDNYSSIGHYFDGYACKDAWSFNSICSSCLTNANEAVFQFVPDSSGIHNFSHGFTCCGNGDVWSAYYKEASSGCNDQNWNFIVCGVPNSNWNADFGPLISGQKYYLLIAGLEPNASICFGGISGNNGIFRLSCPSPLCSQPPDSLVSNAVNNTICAGDSIQLSPIGGMLSLNGYYYWRKDSINGSVISSQKVIIVKPQSTAVYYLSIYDTCNTYAYDSIVINVLPSPQAQINLSGNQNVCAGDSLLLSVSFDSTYNYSWFKNGTNLNIFFNSIYVNDFGFYHSIVTDTNGCNKNSDTTFVSLLNLPTISFSSGPHLICNNDSLLVSASATSPSTLQWFLNSSLISGATDTFYYATQPGDYSVLATDTSGCKSNLPVFNVIQSIAVADIFPDSSLSICSGDSIQVAVNPLPGYSYQWMKNGLPINGATSTFYNAISAGNYFVVATDSMQCSANSDSLFLTLLALPQVLLSPQGVTNFCSGDSVLLTLTGDTTVSDSWIRNGSVLSGVNSKTFYAKLHGYYWVSSTDTNGCMNSSNQILLITNCANPPVWPPSPLKSSSPIETEFEFYIVPNPVKSNSFDIVFTNPLSEASTVEIFDGTGRQIYKTTISNHEVVHHILLANLSSGIYNCLITSAHAHRTLKFVVE